MSTSFFLSSIVKLVSINVSQVPASFDKRNFEYSLSDGDVCCFICVNLLT